MESLVPETTTSSTKNEITQQVHISNQTSQRGSGFRYLQAVTLSSSPAAKHILESLLLDNGIELPLESLSNKSISRKKPRKPIETSMSDERVMQLAQEGELSFLASLLKVIEEEGGNVTTKFLIKACCLSVEPAKLPALLDAKEAVMAALHFLSQSMHYQSTDQDIFPTLPLIRPLQQSSDLEKRAYEKVGDWMLKDILPQILNLEDVFYESASEYRWIARHHACPDLKSGRDLLLLKGSPPAYATGRPKKSTSVPRRKSSNNKKDVKDEDDEEVKEQPAPVDEEEEEEEDTAEMGTHVDTTPTIPSAQNDVSPSNNDNAAPAVELSSTVASDAAIEVSMTSPHFVVNDDEFS